MYRRLTAPAIALALTTVLAPGARAAPTMGTAGSYAPPSSWTAEVPQQGSPSAADADERASGEDQPDAVGGGVTHAVYFVPKDRPNENLDLSGALVRSIDGMRAWFYREMRKQPRFDRIPGTSAYDITYVRGMENAGHYDSLQDIVDELKMRGFAAADKRYLVYAAVNRGMTCGEGQFPYVPSSETGRYAAVYLDSVSSCGARDFGGGTAATAGKAETIAAHEWLHNEGVVPLVAPHSCPPPAHSHACTGPLWLTPENDPEAPDVMFPIIVRRLATAVLDRDRDDYLDHPWPYADLRDSRWLE